MASTPAAGPSRAPVKRGATATNAPKPKLPRAAAAGPSARDRVTRPVAEIKPQIDVGEAEWAELMRNGTGNKNPDWYARGVKTVQVGLVRKNVSDEQDKWELLPAFLKVKGLVKQHLDSFNYFINVDIKAILAANSLVVSDVDHATFIRYTDIRVGQPQRNDTAAGSTRLTPMECRLTDCNYSGRIFVDIEYSQENTVKRQRGVPIGSIPVMLRSDLCHLKGKNEKELARMGECPMDPGGYFVVKGTEKVILVQEQLSKNRIIVMTDPKKDVVTAEVTS